MNLSLSLSYKFVYFSLTPLISMKKLSLIVCFALLASVLYAQRSETLLHEGWFFHRGDLPEAKNADFIEKNWQSVTVPHDWAVYGPFGSSFDLQNVAVTQNGETEASLKSHGWFALCRCRMVPNPFRCSSFRSHDLGVRRSHERGTCLCQRCGGHLLALWL